jgi:hypothetical protein
MATVIETSGFLGFQVATIATGQILYTVPVNGFTFNGFNQIAPSHSISLSPDEQDLYISDWPHSCAHVFDVSDLPGKELKKVSDIKLHSMAGSESPCQGGPQHTTVRARHRPGRSCHHGALSSSSPVMSQGIRIPL